MVCRWHIDEWSPRRIAGWIDDEGPVAALDVAVNGHRVVTLSPTEYRKDLEEAGFGDGRRSFALAIAPYLVEPDNFVTISRDDAVLHAATLQSPARQTALSAAAAAGQPAADAALLAGATRVERTAPAQRACEFYHVSDLPDGTATAGQWDLRQSADDYLGRVDFAGKRVIEIGPASGFLSFHMERQGARVAAIEPPMQSFWDLVPQAAVDAGSARGTFGAHIMHIRNSFWFLHRLYGSGVECYEADAYRLPPQPVRFDIGVLASVLLHVSSPVRMLESVAATVEGQLVIVERYFPEIAAEPLCRLLPTAANRSLETWWDFSPRFFEQYLGVLGFPHTTVTRHRQFFLATNQWYDFFTIVGSR